MRFVTVLATASLLITLFAAAGPALAHHESSPCYPGEGPGGDQCSYVNGCPDGSAPTHDANGWDCPNSAPRCSDGSPAERTSDGNFRCSYSTTGEPSGDAYTGDEPPPFECPSDGTWTRLPDRTWGCFDQCPSGSTRATDSSGREYCIAPANMEPGTRAPEEHDRGDTPPPLDCPNGAGWSRMPDGTWGCFDECPPGWTESADAEGRTTCIAPEGATWGSPDAAHATRANGTAPTTSANDTATNRTTAASGSDAQQDAASHASGDAEAAATPALGIVGVLGAIATLAIVRRRA